MSKDQNKFKVARKKARRFERGFTSLIRAHTAKHKMPEAATLRFKDYLGLGMLTDDLWVSDLKLRRKASHFLGDFLEDLRRDNPSLGFRFVTLLPTVGHTSDRDPVVDLKRIRAWADRAFRSQGLDAVYIIEVQGLGNHPNEGKGRTLMVHVHAITWCSESIDFNAIEEKIRQMDCWGTEFDASPVDIRNVKDGEGELYYLAHYLLKAPAEVKMLEQRSKGPRLKNTERGLRPEFASRILELLSQLTLEEMFRSVGQGKLVRNDVLRRLKRWHESRKHWSKGRLPSYLHEQFWSEYRTKKKRVRYAPYLIIR